MVCWHQAIVTLYNSLLTTLFYTKICLQSEMTTSYTQTRCNFSFRLVFTEPIWVTMEHENKLLRLAEPGGEGTGW